MYLINPLEPYIEPGDILRRDDGIYFHYGVAWYNGQVLHNTIKRGEHLVSLETFIQDKPLEVIRTHPSKRNTVLQNASGVLGNPQSYDLIFNNCEQTATRISQGQPRSRQLLTACLLIGVFVLGIAAGRRMA